jgi:hypothetical protein
VSATNPCGTDTYAFVLSVYPSEVHIFFTPAASGGSGTKLDAFSLSSGSSYSFTAKDDTGADITASVEFQLENEDGGAENDPAYFDGSILHTGPFGFGTIRTVGVWHSGQPDEVRSNPDLAGEQRYFAVQ